MPQEYQQIPDEGWGWGSGGGGAVGTTGPYDPNNPYEIARRSNISPLLPQGNNYWDAWSTSMPWRPEAPTGGLYGIYSALAGGQMSPSEWGLQNYLLKQSIGGADEQDVALWRLANEFRQQADPYLDAGMAGLQEAGKVKNYEADLYAQMIRNSQTPGEAEAAQLQGYKSMLGSGYSPEELAAISSAGNVATRAGFQTMGDEMRRAALRSGNKANLYGNMAAAGLQQTNQLADQARNTQILNAQEKQRRTEAGLSGLGTSAGISQQRIMGNQGQAASLAQGVGQRQLGAAQGYQGLSGLNLQRQAQTMGQMQGTQNAWRQANQGYAGLLQGAQNALRQSQQAGAAGLQNLYGSQMAQESDLYKQIAEILGRPRYVNTQLGKTTGNIGLG